DRPPLDAGEVRDEPRVEQGQAEEDQVEGEGGQVLAGEHLAVAHRVGEQQLHGPRLLLLREEPHGQHRDEEQEHHAHVGEERAHHVLDHVEVLASELRLHERPHRGVAVEEEDLAEEPARDQQEEREHHVRHRRAEVEPHLLLEDGQPAHQRASSSRAAAGISCSPATTRMNTSSRLMPTWCSSCSAQPLPVTSRTRSPRTSRPCSDSTTKPTAPSRAASGSAASTPGTARSAAGNTCCTSSDSVLWATTCPRLMMITPSHTIETSGRMWVERITVCWPARERISERICAIW